ncbi:unnamed protein product, partial [marine sediment metagenome]
MKKGLSFTPSMNSLAAGRIGSYKLIRVDSLGFRLYNLDSDPGEEDDLGKSDTNKLRSMTNELEEWKKGLMPPL